MCIVIQFKTKIKNQKTLVGVKVMVAGHQDIKIPEKPVMNVTTGYRTLGDSVLQ